MRKSDYNYRPNPLRAVYLTAELTDKFAAEILPKILELRVGLEPLTVYINSPGGSLPVLDTIHGALTCRDADDRCVRVITVALGEAASAAATMLVLGDYAIVHPHSIVHFHGARFSDISTMTMEHASSFAARLQALNRSNAQKMALQCIGRVVRRHVQLMPEILKEKKAEEVVLQDFVERIKLRTSGSADRVIDRTMARIENAEKLSVKVFGKPKPKSANTQAKADAVVLKALIDYELSVNNYEGLRIDESFLADITADYSLVRDYHLGEHHRQLNGIIRSQGPALLTAEQQSEYTTMCAKEDRKTVTTWLIERIGAKLRELWHYSVLMCRELQSGENRLSANDVYWLGCVDEVIGSDRLLGERADAETEIVPTA